MYNNNRRAVAHDINVYFLEVLFDMFNLTCVIQL